MLNLSKYNIYLEIPDSKDECMLVHGYTGAVDIVTKELFQLLKSAKVNPEELKKICKDDLNELIRRGYITDKTMDEEVAIFKRIADTIYKIEDKFRSFTLLPTYDCNFRCTYCYEQKLHQNGKEWMQCRMDKKVADSVFNKIKALKEEGKVVEEIHIFGGEPLVKENYEIVKHIVDRSSELDLKVSCVSNGYELEYYKDLIGKGKIQDIQITIDGTAETHDNRRFLAGRKPTFEKIMENIELALKNGVGIYVRSNIDSNNINEIETIVNLFKEKGFNDYSNFSYYFKAVHECYLPFDETKVNEIDIMRKLDNLDLPVHKFYMNSMYSSISAKFGEMFTKGGYAPMKTRYCGAVSGMLVVDPRGDIYPCWDNVGHQEHMIGRIDEKGEINLNEDYNYWNERVPQNIDECKECPYALFCGGGCPAFAKVVSGNEYKPYCLYFKKIFNEVLPEVYKRIEEKTYKK